uniref:Histidinol dehydrogenase n=1 Tax=Desertifilum tharense IPPAS B-1220 TaxID=1781255 RepID=A0ACD5H132_9CYAN
MGVETFLKHSSLIQYSPTALNKMGNAIITLAETEGLNSHADSVRLRIENRTDDA